MTHSYDIEGLNKGVVVYSLTLGRLQIKENLSYEKKCKLLKLICK